MARTSVSIVYLVTMMPVFAILPDIAASGDDAPAPDMQARVQKQAERL